MPDPTLSASVDALLLCHPASPCPAVGSIEVAAAFAADGGLTVRYRVHGQRDELRIPPPLPCAPADGLWQHTCCEAFIAANDQAGYREFNFSPSGLWAVYRFTDYRQRDTGYTPPAAPQINLQQLADGFALDARLAPQLLPAGRTLHLGLSVVIEAADGGKSYWALAHNAAQPDFHLRQSFTLALNRPSP